MIHQISRRVLFVAGLFLAWTGWCARDEAFTPVSMGASGLVGDGVALFVPEGVEAGRLPYSPVLVDEPKIRGALSAGWRVAPIFSSNGRQFRAAVAVGDGDDLYGGGEVMGALRRNGTSITLWNVLPHKSRLLSVAHNSVTESTEV